MNGPAVTDVSCAPDALPATSGAVCTVVSRLAEQQLRSGVGLTTYEGVQSTRARGEVLQWVSLGLYGAGSLAAVIAVVIWGVTSADVQASVAAVPGGAFGTFIFTLP